MTFEIDPTSLTGGAGAPGQEGMNGMMASSPGAGQNMNNNQLFGGSNNKVGNDSGKSDKQVIFELYKRYMLILQDTLDTYEKGYIEIDECSERCQRILVSVDQMQEKHFETE